MAGPEAKWEASGRWGDEVLAERLLGCWSKDADAGFGIVRLRVEDDGGMAQVGRVE